MWDEDGRGRGVEVVLQTTARELVQRAQQGQRGTHWARFLPMNSKEPRLPMSTGLGLQATHRNTCGWKRKIELTRTIGNGPVDDKPLKRVPCAPAWLALPQIGWARRSLAPSNRNEYKHHCWLHLEPGPVKHASQMRKPWRLSRHGCPSPGLPCPWAQTKP